MTLTKAKLALLNMKIKQAKSDRTLKEIEKHLNECKGV